MADKFCLLFPNRKKAILRSPGCRTWTTLSKHWAALSDEQILKCIAGEDPSIWGVRWGEHTRFGVLDIDAGSKYHSAQELTKLTELLAGVGLTATPYQSSSSGGWHVYLFLDQWQTSEEVRETLRSLLASHGYEIRNGVLEIFPSGRLEDSEAVTRCKVPDRPLAVIGLWFPASVVA